MVRGGPDFPDIYAKVHNFCETAKSMGEKDNFFVKKVVCGQCPNIKRHSSNFEDTDLATRAHLEATVALCSKYTQK